jgi:soluble P-type ATPase
MFKLEIPGFGSLQIENLLCDLNGTLAVDGVLSTKTREKILKIKEVLNIHIVTAGTHGHLDEVKKLGITLVKLDPGMEAEQKLNYLLKLGPEKTAVLGNGANDFLMMEKASLKIAVLGREGAFIPTLQAAQIVVISPEDALELFLSSKRLLATLRR